jgi:primosomal protein N' (replication factor Y)
MRFLEVVVNVPIRRTFARLAEPAEEEDSAAELPLQLFHYHLPAEWIGAVAPGHLVWVPFGNRTLLGVVVALSEQAPVVTKPIARLARPDPVMTPEQIALAFWLANTYVAPISEAVKLFLPPGALNHNDDKKPLQARHEDEIRLLLPPDEAGQQLLALARTTPQTAILDWFVRQAEVHLPPMNSEGLLLGAGERTDLTAVAEGAVSAAALMAACALRSTSAIDTLVKRGVLAQSDAGLRLAVDLQQAAALLDQLRGLTALRPIVAALAAADTPLWKSDLYAAVKAAGNSAGAAELQQLADGRIIAIADRVRFRDPLAGRTYASTTAPALTGEQRNVWRQVEAHAFPTEEVIAPAAFLLHGVTGSGKTEIYLRAIQETLARGRQAIVLIPEIALTPQTVARFAGRFPGRVTVIHSQLSPGERYDVWRAIREGRFDVVVGPRSALFAPFAHLGLIIIDEEHESTYKQDAEEWGSFKVFYDARPTARRLAALTGSVLMLGSATPSLESYYATQQGELTLLRMPRRVLGHRMTAAGEETLYLELPPVEIVDMRQELRANHRSIFSRSLTASLQETLAAGEQTILFLNRRGTSTFVLCRDCGHVLNCPRCEVPLTLHEHAGMLICHHCSRRYPIPTLCPECQSKRIKYFGAGTERIEEAVREIAPAARVLRWDADTTGRKGSHEAILSRFAAGEADILVGTQMIAKGLDLPMVTLVGVVAADVGLFLPDFRAGERTFQLLTQVAGRAGRSGLRSRVIFQSYRPDHYAIQAAARHDFEGFYRRELSFRQEHQYPPVRRLARLVYWHKQAEAAEEAANHMADLLRRRLAELGASAAWTGVMGPAPAFFSRVRGNYRWMLLVRAPDPAALLRTIEIPFGWRVDVDPLTTL